MRQLCLTLCLGLLLAGTAHAGSFAPIPALDGKKTSLQLRQVDFTGGASGQVVVEVRNAGHQAQTFQARGLYFVPQGDAQSAPQRVGAAGPFEVNQGNGWQRKTELQIQPGQTVRLKLQTFCLDSHRGSPGKGQGFKVARERLPKHLTTEIESGAQKILKAKAPAAANGDIQSHVWNSRNKKWIKLEGERANEKDGSEQRSLRRMPIQRQQNIAE
jgi:hypothetical protein